MKNQLKSKGDQLPSWLFFGLYNGMSPQQKWSSDKEFTGQYILRCLKSKAEMFDIDISKVTAVNQFDDHQPYGINQKAMIEEFDRIIDSLDAREDNSIGLVFNIRVK